MLNDTAGDMNWDDKGKEGSPMQTLDGRVWTDAWQQLRPGVSRHTDL